MSMRDFLNKNQPLVVGVMVLLILGAVAYAFMAMRGDNVKALSDQFYFIDEDKTAFEDCFAAAKDSIPPFDHDGKQAVRARVFLVQDKPTVLFLEKCTPEFKQKLEEAKASAAAKGTSTMSIDAQMKMGAFGMLVKRPGDAEWKPYIDKASQAIMRPPNGPDGKAVPEYFPPAD